MYGILRRWCWWLWLPSLSSVSVPSIQSQPCEVEEGTSWYEEEEM